VDRAIGILRSDGSGYTAQFDKPSLVATLVNSVPRVNSADLDPLLIAVIGPTGSGKSALAIALADSLNGEIVSCDSVAVYRELEIGTAKPSSEQRARVQHHIIDIAAPTDLYTAGDYSRDARVAIADIHTRGKMPIIAGGTGLYLRALLDGLFAGPQRNDAIRDQLQAIALSDGPVALHRRLIDLDPITAGKTHPNDTPKIIRALEVCLATEKPISEIWQQGRNRLTGWQVQRIGLDPPRELLKQRINERAAAMFEAGLIDETQGLIARYGEHCRSLTSLGYAQSVAVLRGELSKEEAVILTQDGHRQYAKRQRTWFRREKDVHWLQGFGEQEGTISCALEIAKTTQAGIKST